MKATVIIFVLTIELLAWQLPAQGTLYLSNLGQTPIGSSATGSNAWLAGYFLTGSEPNGYSLDSVQLLLAPTSGNPSGFAVSIYNPSTSPFPASLFPGNSLGTLSGPNPAAGGIYAYTASGITLPPITGYFVVITSATPITDGSFNWSFANPGTTSTSDRWNMGSYQYYSTDGSQWTRATGPVFQFGVFATVVPEPSKSLLMGFGLLGLSFWRYRRRQQISF
jgi:hypothetical protein